MNYIIYTKKDGESNSKRVLFNDGTDYCVSTDNDGYEYFPVPNLLINNPKNDPFKKLFTNRIWDAVETIRRGDGDALKVTKIFGFSEKVVRFIDREYGESIRQKTIEGFKDTSFGYSLKFGYLSAMTGNSFISKTNNILSTFDVQTDYIFFNTKEEAVTFKDSIISKAQDLVAGYEKTENKKEYFKKFINTNIVSIIAIAMLQNKNSGDKYNWELVVVQVIKI